MAGVGNASARNAASGIGTTDSMRSSGAKPGAPGTAATGSRDKRKAPRRRCNGPGLADRSLKGVACMNSVARDGKRGGSALVTALIYTRVSSDEQAREGVSLDAQLAECRHYAARKGWVLGDEYQDVMAGTRDDRPRYQALLADVRRFREDGRSVTVVVAALDRFGRKLLERVRCREELKGLGVAVHAVREGGEVSDLVANILASVAQEEVRRLGERVSAARQHIRTGGWKTPGRPAFGYRWRDASDHERKQGAPKSVLDVDPTTAPFAREMFQRVADGESIRSVARWLAVLPDDARGGRVMNLDAVRQALRAPVYIARNFEVGRRFTGDPDVLARPCGNWPALVSDELFIRVQARTDGHRAMPRQASGRYLLTGLLRCPKCACRMRASTRIGAGNPRYVCSASHVGALARDVSCRYQAVGHRVDAAVLGEVGLLLDDATATIPEMKGALRRAWAALAHPRDNSEAFVRTCEAAAAKARERIKRLALLFADGDIDRQGYELGRAQAQADLEAAEAELGRLRVVRPTPALPTLEEALHHAGRWHDLLATGDTRRQREVLAVLVDRVIPERISHGKYTAVIVWSETGEQLRTLVAATRADSAA
jgi:DNA invertase Pin-like site-specific DNA recombinase